MKPKKPEIEELAEMIETQEMKESHGYAPGLTMMQEAYQEPYIQRED